MAFSVKKSVRSCSLVLLFLSIGCFALAAENKPIYSIDFSSPGSNNPRDWLKSKGYECEKDATSDDELALSFSGGALVLEAKSRLFGLIINKDLHLDNAKTIRITWGVDQFPDGANYEKKVNNEAIMVYVYYGNKSLSSDSLFIPNGPYFIGLFPGRFETLNKPFIGHHFTQGGRFVCIAHPELNKTIVSEFDLKKGFENCFGNVESTVPYISSIALEVETSSSGPSKAFIKKIEIF